ncbi:MAG TPA: hypothetical protein VJI68_02745 [Candidatus Nanoarchaeia archaeon]|nr:hypothetical protein [Candidatus Nanoarchaeia archaeon]
MVEPTLFSADEVADMIGSVDLEMPELDETKDDLLDRLAAHNSQMALVGFLYLRADKPNGSKDHKLRRYGVSLAATKIMPPYLSFVGSQNDGEEIALEETRITGRHIITLKFLEPYSGPLKIEDVGLDVVRDDNGIKVKVPDLVYDSSLFDYRDELGLTENNHDQDNSRMIKYVVGIGDEEVNHTLADLEERFNHHFHGLAQRSWESPSQLYNITRRLLYSESEINRYLGLKRALEDIDRYNSQTEDTARELNKRIQGIIKIERTHLKRGLISGVNAADDVSLIRLAERLRHAKMSLDDAIKVVDKKSR